MNCGPLVPQNSSTFIRYCLALPRNAFLYAFEGVLLTRVIPCYPWLSADVGTIWGPLSLGASNFGSDTRRFESYQASQTPNPYGVRNWEIRFRVSGPLPKSGLDTGRTPRGRYWLIPDDKASPARVGLALFCRGRALRSAAEMARMISQHTHNLTDIEDGLRLLEDAERKLEFFRHNPGWSKELEEVEVDLSCGMGRIKRALGQLRDKLDA